VPTQIALASGVPGRGGSSRLTLGADLPLAAVRDALDAVEGAIKQVAGLEAAVGVQ
jgi:hypothetical protein